MDEDARPAKRPRRNAPRTRGDDGSRNNPLAPKPADSARSKPGQDVRFLYSRKGEQDPKEPWEEAVWDREDAFSELLRQWRADLMSKYELNSDKFAANVETTDRQVDGHTVEIVYSVRKPRVSQEPLEYLGHVRYRGNRDGEGTVDIATRGITMQFPDIASGSAQQPPQKSIGNPKLEKAILVLMDDNQDHLHRVRLVSGQQEWQFRFDNKPANHFSARQWDFGTEECDWVHGNASPMHMEAEARVSSSEARPWQDTLLAIGEPPDPAPGRREKVYDSCGRSEQNRWSRIQEQDFRNWTRRALFLFTHSFVGAYKGLENYRDCNWFYTSNGEIVHDDRFAGRLYLDGLQLCRWECAAATTSSDPGFRYAYNIRRGSEQGPVKTDRSVPSSEAEAQAIAAIWKTAVCEYPKLACQLLHQLLKTSAPPHRESLTVVHYLDEDVATVLSGFLSHPDTKAASGKRPWCISASDSNTELGQALVALKLRLGSGLEVLPDTYWSLFGKFKLLRGAEEEMRRICDQAHMSHVELAGLASTALLAARNAATLSQPQTRPSSSSVTSMRTSPDKSSREESTEASTAPSVGWVTEPSIDLVPGCPENAPSRRPSASSEVSADLVPQMLSGPHNVLFQRVQYLEAELGAARERALALEMALDARTVTDNSANPLWQHEPKIPQATESSGYTDDVVDDATDERVAPVPSGFFPNEVMRLVQLCLTLCPEPVRTYTCHPIEGATRLSVAGAYRLDHDSRVLKIHKDWLSMDRMRQNLESPEDTTTTDLLCHTVLGLWEDVLRSESLGTLDGQNGRAGWARCRGEIRRCLLDYRQICRQIMVPELLRKHGELSVLTSNLANSGWAKENDNIHLSLHCRACPWLRRLYTTWKTDPFDRHFTEITPAGASDREDWPVTETRRDPCRSCHGVAKTGAARVPLYALKFEGLDPRKSYFAVARNLSRPDSLIVILDGLYAPQPANNPVTPFAAKWCSDMEAMLKSYVARGCLLQPLFLNLGRGSNGLSCGLQQLSWPELSRTAKTSLGMHSPSLLSALQRRLKEEQHKLAKLKESPSPDMMEVEVAQTIASTLQNQVAKEQRKHDETAPRVTVSRHPPPTRSGPLAPPNFRGPPPRAAASGHRAGLAGSALRPPFTTPDGHHLASPAPPSLRLSSFPRPSPGPAQQLQRQSASALPRPATTPIAPPKCHPLSPLPPYATRQPGLGGESQQSVVHNSIVVKDSAEPEGVDIDDDSTTPGHFDPGTPGATEHPFYLQGKVLYPGGKDFYVLEGDDMLAPQLINARKKICRRWGLSPKELLAMFPGMSASRNFMVNLCRLTEKHNKEDTLRFLERARTERRKVSRGQSWMGVSIFDEWTVKDTRTALEYAGLADRKNKGTPASRGSAPDDGGEEPPTRSTHLSSVDTPTVSEKQATTAIGAEDASLGSPAEAAARARYNAAEVAYAEFMSKFPQRASTADCSKALDVVQDTHAACQSSLTEKLLSQVSQRRRGVNWTGQPTQAAAAGASGNDCIVIEDSQEPPAAPRPPPAIPTREPSVSKGVSGVQAGQPGMATPQQPALPAAQPLPATYARDPTPVARGCDGPVSHVPLSTKLSRRLPPPPRPAIQPWDEPCGR